MARYRMRDVSGLESLQWAVVTVLERKTLFGWSRIYKASDDLHGRTHEAVQALHIDQLSKQMERNATDGVIAEF